MLISESELERELMSESEPKLVSESASTGFGRLFLFCLSFSALLRPRWTLTGFGNVITWNIYHFVSLLDRFLVNEKFSKFDHWKSVFFFSVAIFLSFLIAFFLSISKKI